MAIQVADGFISGATFTSGTGAITPSVPTTLADGDVMLMLVESANQAIATPTGWTEAPNSPQFTGTAAVAGGVRLAVFYKVVFGAQSDPTIADTGDHTAAQITWIRGADTARPFTSSAGGVVSVASTSWPCPSITPLITGEAIVVCIGQDHDGNDTHCTSGVGDGPMDATTASGTGGGVAIRAMTSPLPPTGTPRNDTVTSLFSTTAALITLGIRPAGVTPTLSSPTAISITATTADPEVVLTF